MTRAVAAGVASWIALGALLYLVFRDNTSHLAPGVMLGGIAVGSIAPSGSRRSGKRG